LYWRRKLKKCGKRFYTGIGVVIQGVENIELADNVILSDGCFVNAGKGYLKIGNNTGFNTNTRINAYYGKIIIGNDVLVASNVEIRSSNHAYKRRDVLIREQGYIEGEINISDDVWIAANAVILSGSKIGEGAVVAAGSVVNCTIDDYHVVGGVPAKVIGIRNQADGL
jgi:galactoside O-acetyltransferase